MEMSAYKYVAPTKITTTTTQQETNHVSAPQIERPLKCEITYQRLDLSNLFPRKRDAFAVILDGVFTHDECKQLIERSEAAGYDEALVGGKQVRQEQQRNNWRCIINLNREGIIDDTELAEAIFRRVYNYLPTEWLGVKVAGLNERMRFLKYHPGEYFKPHNDGIYVRDDNSQCSYVTIHLYLSDVEEGGGGETTFTTEDMTYGRHVHKKGRMEGEEIKRLSVRPVTGRVLIFEHHLPHEGSTLLKGVKYTVRTDVMYDLRGDATKRKKGERGPNEEKEVRGENGEKRERGEEGKAVHRGPRWSVRYPHPQYKLGKALSMVK